MTAEETLTVGRPLWAGTPAQVGTGPSNDADRGPVVRCRTRYDLVPTPSWRRRGAPGPHGRSRAGGRNGSPPYRSSLPPVAGLAAVHADSDADWPRCWPRFDRERALNIQS